MAMAGMESEHFGGPKGSMKDDITEISVFGDIQRWKSRKINMLFGREKHVPHITGCCVMPDPDGTVVICDNAISKVKVLDKHRKVINNAKEVPGPPFDVDSFDETSAVVSIPEKKEVLFLCIRPGLKLEERKISLSGKCYGIAVRNGEIYVCIPDEGIQIVSQTGETRACIKCDKAAPKYVYVNADAIRIYYSCDAGLVCCRTRKGHFISMYDSDNLPNPGSLVADGMDNLLVCNNASRKILQLKRDGTFGKIIPLSSDGSGNAGNFTSMCSNRSCEILILATAAKCKSELVLYEPTDEANDERVHFESVSSWMTVAQIASAVGLTLVAGVAVALVINRK